MTEDYEYHQNKKPDKTYISKSLSFRSQGDRKIRIASKVLDSLETHSFVLENGEHVIRVTEGDVRRSLQSSTRTRAEFSRSRSSDSLLTAGRRIRLIFLSKVRRFQSY